jgi:xanthine dehydrogenase accessory factor
MATELTRVATAAREALATSEEAILATVIRVGGSTYRRPGARMLLSLQGAVAGSISGGCLEEDLRQKAWWRTNDGPAVVTYDSTAEDDEIEWGFGLGCNGVVEVLLERLDAENVGYLTRLEQWQTTRLSGVLATTCDARRLSLDETGVFFGDEFLLKGARQALETACSTWQEGTFFEYVVPPQRLVVFGAGHDIVPVVQLATGLLGWHLVVVDARSQTLHPERFPGAQVVRDFPLESLKAADAVVLMTHSLEADKEFLPEVLASDVGYIGLLGPKRRSERLMDLAMFPERLRAPLGLDIGADTPEEIALSLIAEIRAWSAGRSGGALSLRAGSIH